MLITFFPAFFSHFFMPFVGNFECFPHHALNRYIYLTMFMCVCVYGAFSVAWVISHIVWNSIAACVWSAVSAFRAPSGLVIAAHLLFLALNLVNAVARASINYNSRQNCFLFPHIYFMPQSCWQSCCSTAPALRNSSLTLSLSARQKT